MIRNKVSPAWLYFQQLFRGSMKYVRWMVLLALLVSLLPGPVARGQRNATFYAGYNSFNELYVGRVSACRMNNLLTLELAYQAALSESHLYSSGSPFNLHNTFLSNNLSGFRFRVGNLKPLRQPGKVAYGGFGLELQALRSNKLIEDLGAYSGSNSSTGYSEFVESYLNLGPRYTRSSPILNGHWHFTYSVAILMKFVERQYSVEGTFQQRHPSDKLEYRYDIGLQLSVGIRKYFGDFKTKSPEDGT